MPVRGPARTSPAANASVNPAIAARPISDPTMAVAANAALSRRISVVAAPTTASTGGMFSCGTA